MVNPACGTLEPESFDYENFFACRFQDPSFAPNEYQNVTSSESTEPKSPEEDARLIASGTLGTVDLPPASPIPSSASESSDCADAARLLDEQTLEEIVNEWEMHNMAQASQEDNIDVLTSMGEVALPPIMVPAPPAPAPESAPATISPALLAPAYVPGPINAFATYQAYQEPNFVVPIIEDQVNIKAPSAYMPINFPTVSPAISVPSLPASASISPVELSLKRKLPDGAADINPEAPRKRRGRPPKNSLPGSGSDTPTTNSSPVKSAGPRANASTARPSACVPAKFVKEATEIMGVTAEDIKHHVDFESLMTIVSPERREASVAFGERIATNRVKQAEAAANTRQARAAQLHALEAERDEAIDRANLFAQQLAQAQAELAQYKTWFNAMAGATPIQPRVIGQLGLQF